MARAARVGRLSLVALAAIALLAGCAAGAPSPGDVAETTPPPASASPSDPAATGTDAAGGAFVDPWVNDVGAVTATSDGATAVASALEAPWSVVRLASGAALVSERDSGRVLELLADGATREVLTVPDVAHGGEGGLLGLAATAEWLFAMHTAADGNRIVRFPLTATAIGSVAVGSGGVGSTPEVLLAGIPSASNHNGGRLAIGPDGYLYATTGDAAQPQLAQDRDSLAGKILRLGLDGSVPPDNPFDTLVYSMGHRNPQGLAWDRDGGLWASEFGQNTWDELNRIEPGANYGWPTVEGIADAPEFTNPVLQWATSEASPSGLARVGDTLFLASLRGERLWRIDIADPQLVATPLFVGEFGRVRDVIAGPAESIWIVTNNTDGRGSPMPGDDRILQLTILGG